MATDFFLVDAFAASAFSGNVAGVVPDADALSDRKMQAIAAEFGAPETTFVSKATIAEASLRFRWFTPACEVDFCGHATLAAVHALLESGRVPIETAPQGAFAFPPVQTRSGVLSIAVQASSVHAGAPIIWLDMPHCQPLKDPVNVPTVCRHLGLDPGSLDPELRPITTADRDILLAVRDTPTLLRISPSMGDLARFCTSQRLRGVMVTTTKALSTGVAAQSRFFAPAVGIDEDPVTGSVHGPLALHLVRSGIVEVADGRAEFLCAQGKAGGRAGVVRALVDLTADQSARVCIGGSCVITARGSLCDMR